MKLECKHKPHFSGGELGFIFRCIFTMALLFALISCAALTTSVIKMTSTFPNIIKSYKALMVHAKRTWGDWQGY